MPLLLAPMTPRYFQSEPCGQEWRIFADRTARYDQQNGVDSSLLKPLMWIPARPGHIHPVAPRCNIPPTAWATSISGWESGS